MVANFYLTSCNQSWTWTSFHPKQLHLCSKFLFKQCKKLLSINVSRFSLIWSKFKFGICIFKRKGNQVAFDLVMNLSFDMLHILVILFFHIDQVEISRVTGEALWLGQMVLRKDWTNFHNFCWERIIQNRQDDREF